MTQTERIRFAISTALLTWAVPSIVVGALGLLATASFVPSPVLRGIALHALLWGAIDAGLAGAGRIRSRRDAAAYPDEYRDVAAGRKLRRTLLINGFLDIGYIAIGVALIVLFPEDRFIIGNGIGVLIQAVFLLLFDFINAQRLPKAVPPWYDPAP
ncbi:MAG: hypothetical protein PF508_06000 [Spirochaeta sp.]|nr:hypothetical protein [Spirochaeta sp.]